MKQLFYIVMLCMILHACNNPHPATNNPSSKTKTPDTMNFKSNHAMVNGINLYYEIYGQGKPLVLLHGGGSTIQTSFGRLIPLLDKHYQVIAIELQNHGRSESRNIPQTFEQDAEDVRTLLKQLGISKASFLGFSNGGTTAMLIGMKYPDLTDKLILIAAAYKRDGFINGFFGGMQGATLSNMPEGLKTAFLEVNPDSAKLQIMFERDRDRMIAFTDWTDEQLKSIQAPTLLINGDKDVVTVEHTVRMFRLIPHSRMAILPGEHGAYIGESTTLGADTAYKDFSAPMILEFLKKPADH